MTPKTFAKISFLLAVLLVVATAKAQDRTLAERLGYPRQTPNS
jgi:hypothetical protein